MSIVSMNKLLDYAKSEKFAVGSYNAYDVVTIRGVLSAAEQENSPVILCHAPVHFKYNSLASVINLMKYEAEKTTVPVALLLDHGYKPKTCMEAMDLGFNAVMMDASSLSFTENVALVSKVVNEAHKRECDVEAELGHVTRPKSGGAEGIEDDSVINDTALYTNPEDASKFIELTKADALAVAIGTAHGVYFKKPKLDLNRLSLIREAVEVPLVLHGGSGLSENDIRNAVARGIQKINYYTNMALRAGETIKKKIIINNERVFYHNIMMDSIAAIKEDVVKSMKIFGCSGKA